jgi:hypothetical protein
VKTRNQNVPTADWSLWLQAPRKLHKATSSFSFASAALDDPAPTPLTLLEGQCAECTLMLQNAGRVAVDAAHVVAEGQSTMLAKYASELHPLAPFHGALRAALLNCMFLGSLLPGCPNKPGAASHPSRACSACAACRECT